MTNQKLPKHKTIGAALRKQIVAGKWKAGELIPKEADLCKVYETSRTTIRQALSALESEGLISRSPGRGTQVTDFKNAGEAWKLKSVISDYAFTQEIRSEIISVEPVFPSPTDFLFQAFRDVQDISKIRILRKIKETPFALTESHIPAEYVDEVLTLFDPEKRSIVYQIIEEITGRQVHRIQDVFKPVLSVGEVAKRLNVFEGTPLFHITRVLTDNEGKTVLLAKVHLRTDIQKVSVVIEKDQTFR